MNYTFWFAVQGNEKISSKEYENCFDLSCNNLYLGCLSSDFEGVLNQLDHNSEFLKNGEKIGICKCHTDNQNIIQAIQSVLIGNSIKPLPVMVTKLVWILYDKGE